MFPILNTDHYKLTMAEAGWPFRRETFYYSHRRGGPHLLPFDPAVEIEKLNPFKYIINLKDTKKWLESQGVNLGAWFAGLQAEDLSLDIQSVPAGSWVCDKDPMFVVTGPSFVVSWLEPLVLQLNYQIQIATMAVLAPDRLYSEISEVTCEQQRQIILNTLERVRQLGYKTPSVTIKINKDDYHNHVFNKVNRLLGAVDSSRIFEVGFRSVTCEQQHLIALEAAKEAGLKTTSNVSAAKELGLKSVGTMGHEHVQRYGSDNSAYRAMVERVPGPIFFLIDTFDSINSGIPAAYDIIKEQPHKNHAIRFDSGDIEEQFVYAIKLANSMNIKPRFCLEDSWDLGKTIKFEDIRKKNNLIPDRVLYGYGGYIINSPFTKLTRDRVSAVWKLCQTGNNPTMKFGTDKESIPGRPVLYWSKYGTLIAQRGENISPHFSHYECGFSLGRDPLPNPLKMNNPYNKFYSGIYTPGTKTLVRELKNI